MKLYRVRTNQEIVGEYLNSDSARNHLRHCRQFTREDVGEWVRLEVEDVDRLSEQRVLITGDVAFWQFNRESNGSRTLNRTVWNIRRERCDWIGEVKFLGRVLLVRHDPRKARRLSARFDSDPEWIAYAIRD